MRIVSPPAELLAEVARGLLDAADRLGLPAEVVETTSGAEFGNGFTVPDDVFDAWFLSRGEAAGRVPAAPVAAGIEAPADDEKPKTRRGRGVKPATEGSEA